MANKQCWLFGDKILNVSNCSHAKVALTCRIKQKALLDGDESYSDGKSTKLKKVIVNKNNIKSNVNLKMMLSMQYQPKTNRKIWKILQAQDCDHSMNPETTWTTKKQINSKHSSWGNEKMLHLGQQGSLGFQGCTYYMYVLKSQVLSWVQTKCTYVLVVKSFQNCTFHLIYQLAINHSMGKFIINKINP